MSKRSAGLVMYRVRGERLEVLLVHPGGPFWAKKDQGAWFIPKGEVGAAVDELSAARREFLEETGVQPTGPYLALGQVKHKSGKKVTAWAFQGACDPSKLKSNTFTMEWPPHSGKKQEFPEIDRGEFFTIEAARDKILREEFEFLVRLEELCSKGQSEQKRPGEPG